VTIAVNTLTSTTEQNTFVTNLKAALKTTKTATVSLSYNDGTAYATTLLVNFVEDPQTYPTVAATENTKAWSNSEAVVLKAGTGTATATTVATGTTWIDYTLNTDYTMDVTFTISMKLSSTYTFEAKKLGKYRVCSERFAINGVATTTSVCADIGYSHDGTKNVVTAGYYESTTTVDAALASVADADRCIKTANPTAAGTDLTLLSTSTGSKCTNTIFTEVSNVSFSTTEISAKVKVKLLNTYLGTAAAF